MPPETEFGLLGPLEVRHRGLTVPVPPGKQQALLAALLLSAGRPVAATELAGVLWGTMPPPSARASLHNYVMRLRRSLAPAGQDLIVTQPGGYLIRAGDGELDVTRFERLSAQARVAAQKGQWAAAADALTVALGLWRGEPLAGVPSETLVQREAPRLAELRLQATEARADADLHLGRHAEVIPGLRQLVAAHPLRERLHALLMTALHQDGQRAGALAAYQAARQVLVAELGIEPGPELQRLQHDTLRPAPAPGPAAGRPAARAAPPLASAPAPRPAAGRDRDRDVPRQLPGAVTAFTGRERELAELTALLDQAGPDAPGTLVISAIGGTAGVGKTALAVRWAHQVAPLFPDGQLYVNLRGFDPGQPARPADVLASFLRALGVPGPDIPAETGERASRYRTLLAGRRMLIVLDNAGEAGQVRPLLPGTAGCAVLVTSRDSLSGLVAADGARRLDLGLLPPADAVALLRSLIGERVDASPAAAAELAGHCARLPLALRVAAELAAARPGTGLPELAAELGDEQRRLSLLAAGDDERASVRAVFSWSYRHLDPAAARAFRLAGLHPGPDFEAYAIAALAGVTRAEADRLQRTLARAHLIQPTAAGRYGLHDLLRAYARELSAGYESDEDRRAALTRLLDHYGHTLATAMDVLEPASRYRRLGAPVSDGPAPVFGSQDEGRRWLDAQRAALIAAAGHAAAHGWPWHASRLAATSFRYFETGGHYPEAVTLHTHALAAAAGSGDGAAEAMLTGNLGLLATRQARYAEAIGYFQRALELARAAGDPVTEAHALGNLGVVSIGQGRYRLAAASFMQVAELCRDSGDRTSLGRALGNAGTAELQLGHWPAAGRLLREALALFQGNGDQPAVCYTVATLALLDLRLGRPAEAAAQAREAAGLSRAAGNPAGESRALTILARAEAELGLLDEASGHVQEALGQCRKIGNRAGECEALNALGAVLLAAGQPGGARDAHLAALRLATGLGERYEEARAHDGLGRCGQADGDHRLAQRSWQQALSLFAELEVPEEAQVRAKMGRLPHAPEPAG